MKPIRVVGKLKTPAIFIYGEKDKIIPKKQIMSMFQKYGGPKTLKLIPGQHNSERSGHLINGIRDIICGLLLRHKDPKSVLFNKIDKEELNAA